MHGAQGALPDIVDFENYKFGPVHPNRRFSLFLSALSSLWLLRKSLRPLLRGASPPDRKTYVEKNGATATKEAPDTAQLSVADVPSPTTSVVPSSPEEIRADDAKETAKSAAVEAEEQASADASLAKGRAQRPTKGTNEEEAEDARTLSMRRAFAALDEIFAEDQTKVAVPWAKTNAPQDALVMTQVPYTAEEKKALKEMLGKPQPRDDWHLHITEEEYAQCWTVYTIDLPEERETKETEEAEESPTDPNDQV